MKLIASTLTGTIVYLLVGYLIFEVILGNYTMAHTTQLPGFRKDDGFTSMVFISISCMAYALLLSVILGKWLKTNSPAKGFGVGALVGTLVAVMADFYWYATSTFYSDLSPLLADIVAAAVSVGIMGASIAWVLGRNLFGRGLP